MKKLLKNKKVLSLATLTAAVAIIAAGSYAWFTGNAAVNASISSGRLNATAYVEDLLGESGYYYEPGEAASLEYTIDNTHGGAEGYLPVFVQSDFSAGEVIIRSDNDGNEVTEYTVDIDSDTVTVAPVAKSDTNSEYMSLWFVDRTTGIYYALIEAGADAVANVEIELVGSEMGNMYQGAEFSFTGNFPYTQVNEDATYAMFELDWDNLDPVDESGNILAASARSGMRDYYMNLLYELAGN